MLIAITVICSSVFWEDLVSMGADPPVCVCARDACRFGQENRRCGNCWRNFVRCAVRCNGCADHSYGTGAETKGRRINIQENSTVF